MLTLIQLYVTSSWAAVKNISDRVDRWFCHPFLPNVGEQNASHGIRESFGWTEMRRRENLIESELNEVVIPTGLERR